MSYFNENNNNEVEVTGRISEPIKFDHNLYGIKFYSSEISITRLSGNTDKIPIMISEDLVTHSDILLGKKYRIYGQFRSHNSVDSEGCNHVDLFIFIQQILEEATSEDKSEIILTGTICKATIFRKTPLGRRITDIMLAVNRDFNKSDYIPCIAWGAYAKFAESLSVGTKVKIYGRVQSREYSKKILSNISIPKVAYEVSIKTISIAE